MMIINTICIHIIHMYIMYAVYFCNQYIAIFHNQVCFEKRIALRLAIDRLKLLNSIAVNEEKIPLQKNLIKKSG